MLVDVYTRYNTRLLDPDRAEKRPWEGADRMAEVSFEKVLACEAGEWIEKRTRKTLHGRDDTNVSRTVDDESPVRRGSVYHQSNTHDIIHRQSDPETEDVVRTSSRRSSIQTSHIHIPQPSQPAPTPRPPQRPTLQPTYTSLPVNSTPSTHIPLHLPFPPQAPLNISEIEIEAAPTVKPAEREERDEKGNAVPSLPVRKARPARPVLVQRCTAPERVDGVLGG